jgi:ATP-binding cassette subfamily B protein/ATP-binding cassette subfamily B multidrug efflux pump
MFKFFENLVDPFPLDHPQQPPLGLFQFCRHYTKGLEPYLFAMAVLTVITAVGEAMLYAVLGQVVDWLASQSPKHFFAEQWPLLLGISLYVLVFIPLTVLLHALIINQTLMGNFPMAVRWMAHRYLLSQSFAFFQNEFSGRIATKVMQTALAVRDSVMKILDVMLFVAVYVVTTVLLVASADWRLSVPIVVWLVLYILILRYFVPKLRDISTLQADSRSLMTGRIVDSYTNIITLKLFSRINRESEYVKEGMNEFLQTVHPQMRLATTLEFCVWILNMSLIFFTGLLGILLWQNSAITPGAIAIAMAIAIRLAGMSHWIMWEVSNLFENIGTVQDGMNTLSLSQSVTDKTGAKPLQVSNGEIKFDQVDFAYGNSDLVFEDLSVVINASEKIGIVGRSGAGKSTLVNVLLRFFDVQGGGVFIDSQDIRDVSQQSLRANIAMVTQDTSLLFRSVRENIMFGKPEATEAEMIACAKQAKAYDFIQTLTDINGLKGFDAHVGERGVNLSGGQRQRIAIARVLLKNAPILVLDEATSALDSEVEVSIQQSLYQLMEGKTVIAIAHRLSTIAAMDRLLVFDEGRIVEQGSHQQLLLNNGLYAQLWQHQSGGFLGEQ